MMGAEHATKHCEHPEAGVSRGILAMMDEDPEAGVSRGILAMMDLLLVLALCRTLEAGVSRGILAMMDQDPEAGVFRGILAMMDLLKVLALCVPASDSCLGGWCLSRHPGEDGSFSWPLSLQCLLQTERHPGDDESFC